MLYSMTGFGLAEYEDDLIKIKIEIKSLNHKQFELKLKFPYISAEKNILLRKLLSTILIRGKIDVNVNLELKFQPNKYTIKKDTFKSYYEQLKSLTTENPISPNTDFYSIIMRMPDVLEFEEPDIEDVWKNIEQTFKKAAENLMKFRLQEGLATEKDIVKKIEQIQEFLAQVPNYEQIRNENFRKRLEEALQKNNINVDKDRFEQELIFYLDKYDINEEQQRLKNHIDYFFQTLNEEKIEKGKKLTFIAQEMGREINTLGTKSYCADIQKLVVKMKDNLEKIKEQLANIL